MAEVTIKVADGTCGDGCGQPVAKGRSFRQGHDAKLRSVLGKAYKAGDSVAFVQNGTRKTSSAEAALKLHGFPIPPAAKPRKSRATKGTTRKAATKKATAKRTTRKPRAKRASKTA